MKSMTWKPFMLCEECRSAKAYRETTRTEDGLPDGLILCSRCRANRKAGQRDTRSRVDVNPVAAVHHRQVALAR